MPIPPHGLTGILPPYIGKPTSFVDRSPYSTTLIEVVERFATSQKRVDILKGLLRYRAALHETGMVAGLQWLDGSFVENLDKREPKDIDVVTLYLPPDTWADPKVNADRLALPVFDHDVAFATFHVDSFYVDLAAPPLYFTLRWLLYWHGVFSHRRDTIEWKGMLEVNLAPEHDVAAYEILSGRVFP